MTEQEKFYNEILADLENSTLVLPTLPEVALKVRDVVDNPEATASGLAEIIVTDAALSARLLKVANSALYRSRIPVESVQMAVARLGLIMVKNLVTSLVMEQMFHTTSNRLKKRLHGLWQHSPEINAEQLATLEPATKIAEGLGIPLKPSYGLGKVQIEIFEKTVEHRLMEPTFITAYPTEVSPLARRSDFTIG